MFPFFLLDKKEDLLLADVTWSSFLGRTVSRTLLQTDWL